MYKLKKNVGSNSFSAQFVKIVSHYGGVGYKISVLQWTACFVVGPVAVGGFAFLFGSVTAGRASGLCGGSDLGGLSVDDMAGPDNLAAVGPSGLCLLGLFCPGVRICLLLGPCLCIVSFLCLGFVCSVGRCLGKLGVFRAGQASVCLGPYLDRGWGCRAVGPV